MTLGSPPYRLSKVIPSERQAAATVLASLLAVAVAKVLRGTDHYYFFSDDFLNFIIAHDMGLSWAYLARSAQGEFIPLYRAADWLYFNLFGLAFWPYRVLLAVHHCAVVLLIYSMGRGRFLRLEILLPLAAVIAFTPVFETSFQWWSAAINVLAEALASLIAMRLVADTAPLSVRRKFLSTAFYAAALCFFPKGLFVAAILLAVRVFAARERGETLGGAVATALREVWPVFVTGIAYLSFVVFGRYTSGVAPPSPVLLLDYIWLGWNRGFVTGLLGLDETFPGRIALANMCIIVPVVISIFRNRNTMVLWLGFAVYFVFALGTIAMNRAVVLGLQSSEAARYHADISCFFVALLVLALGSSKQAGASALNRGRFAISLGLTTIGSLHLLLASARVPPVWFVPGSQVLSFVEKFGASVAQAKAGTRVQDGVVPEWVMPQWTFPMRRYHYFLMLFPGHAKLDVGPDPLFAFDDTGQLTPISAGVEAHPR